MPQDVRQSAEAEIITSPTVTRPGLYRMTEGAYHADPCPEPSLSRSVAEKLILQSPRHAWTAHPRFNPVDEPDSTNRRATDIGSACHALLLEQKVEIVAIDADEYRTKAAKEERDAARERGAIPLLNPDRETVNACVAHARRELAGSNEPVIRAIADGGESWPHPFHNELVAAWQDRCGGHWCRIRMDRMVIAPNVIDVIDYKTTEMSAAPDDVARTLFNNNYHLQEAFYRRGIRHLFPAIDEHKVRFRFHFIVQEQKPPHEITVATIDAAGRVIGEKMASAALRLWHRCVTEDHWPGYPGEIKIAELPPYIDTRWCAKEIEDPYLQNLPPDEFPFYESEPYRAPKLMEPV